MGVVEAAVGGVRGEVAEVFFIQFSERAGEGFYFAHDICGVGIGFVFVFAGEPVEERAKPKSDDAGEETEEEKGGDDAAGWKAEAGVEPILFGQDGEGEEAEEHPKHGEEDGFGDVAFFIMADFVGEDGFKFGGFKLGDEGVKQNYFTEFSESGEEGVGMAGAFAAVHDLDVFGEEAGAFAEGEEAVAQGADGERGKFIEERKDENRANDHHEELDGDHANPGPEPPGGAEFFHDFKDESEQGVTDKDGKEQAFDAIHPPEAGRGGVEAEAFFDAELGVPIQREVGYCQENGNDDQEGRFGPDGVAEGLLEGLVKSREKAAEQHGEKDDEIPSEFDFFEAAFGQGVIDGFGVVLGGDGGGEGGRNFVGVSADVALVELFKPDLDAPLGED